LIRSSVILLGKKHIEKRRKTKMKFDKLSGPGNITKSLAIDQTLDGENILSGIINLSPRIHPLDRAVAKQRKNAKRNDKHLWRYSLILK
jgi:3-methyladenine DNA glycosylase Mpg